MLREKLDKGLDTPHTIGDYYMARISLKRDLVLLKRQAGG